MGRVRREDRAQQIEVLGWLAVSPERQGMAMHAAMPWGDVQALPVPNLTGAQGISRQDRQRMAARLLAWTDEREVS